MSNYIKDALLGANPNRKLREESKALVGKWEKTGLLEGIDKDYERSSMSILLENQAKQLITEASSTGTSAESEEWSGVALPLVRRIFAEISAQEFVSVQPMNLPSGLVFYLDFKYGSSFAGKRTVQESLLGKTGPNSPLGSSGSYPDKGLYGAGKFEYTQPTGSTTLVSGSFASSSLADLDFDSEYSASNAGNLYTYTLANAALSSSNSDNQAVRGWKFSNANLSSETTHGKVVDRFTSTNGTDATIVFAGTAGFAVSNVSTGSSGWVADFLKTPTAADRGDFEAGKYPGSPSSIDSDVNIPEVNLEMKSQTIVAKTRKLKAIWTPELAQDLNAYHSVDAEAELTSMLSEYISMEIDLEILDMLISDAQTIDYWSAVTGNHINAAKTAFSETSTGSSAYTQGEWFQTLGTKIQRVSNKIHQLTLRGGANFLVCSPDVATILESIPGYAASTDGTQSNFAMGVQAIGSLKNRWTVYKNPYMTENQILIGFRGSNFLETGAVYAPYVPLIMTPLVYDPTDFTPRKGVMTRYAKKMIRPEFYGKIYVEGLELL
jgi:hypothetical protein